MNVTFVIPVRYRIFSAFVLLVCTAGSSFAQGAKPRNSTVAASTSELRAARAFDTASANSLDLRAFLVKMPKGADLHVHLSGAVYAESWIRAGAEDGLCVRLATLSFIRSENFTHDVSPQPECGEGGVPATEALKDQHLYDALIDAFSMRSFVPQAGVSAHDHFFDAFAKFGGTDAKHKGEWLDEVATRAAAQNEQYLELMETPNFMHTSLIAHELGWQDDFTKMRDALFAHGLRDDVAVARKGFDDALAKRREREHCGEKSAVAACSVEIRFIYQVLRGFSKEQVFAQTLLGFEVASTDSRVVGINFVMPEDGYVSMNDYALHMKMVEYLHGQYPRVHIALHAGELAPGLVTDEGLCCHIRLAVEQGHAERIGHGVSVMYEDHPHELLKEMAAKHVMVEVNLTSNDVILGVAGRDHPFPIYRRFGVPVALSTDDEGVSRIDLTHEYVRAAQTYGLRYGDLKQMVRTGIEHSFLPGASLWAERDVFARIVDSCAKDVPSGDKPSAGCASFLRASEKAQQQWELERRFRVFESEF